MAVRWIQPGSLLDLADDLAGRGAGRGAPSLIRLRRSISSSCYAAFHEVSFRAVASYLDSTVWGARQAEIARWIEHGDLRKLAEQALKPNTPIARALGPLNADVQRIAQDFIDLQDARHRADYDDTYDITKALAIGQADTARNLVGLSGRLSAAGDPDWTRFLRLALGSVKVAKRR